MSLMDKWEFLPDLIRRMYCASMGQKQSKLRDLLVFVGLSGKSKQSVESSSEAFAAFVPLRRDIFGLPNPFTFVKPKNDGN